jgi:hypothetical protein
MVNMDHRVGDNSLINSFVKIMRYLRIQKDNLKCKKQGPKLFEADLFLYHFSFLVHPTHIYLPMKMEQSVPKCRHINSRHRGITQKKAYNKVPKV